ncbi:hypothetical protein F4778DRAFT_120196 [Xylariomycetidae sp. FL2044]|nr:hypothetical protein F4778DRAFT_120196 [Xylariomycetidae sp. FL2044]
MQDNREHEAMFDDRKYYFPAGTLEARQPQPDHQPWLEVTPLRDEQGTPGLQPLPEEATKFANGGLYEQAAPYRTVGAIHADELSDQGIQAVSAPMSVSVPASIHHYEAQYQPQYAPQYQHQFPIQAPQLPQQPYQWPDANALPSGYQYAPPSQIQATSDSASWSYQQPSTHDLHQPLAQYGDYQHLHPGESTTSASSWMKDEQPQSTGKKIHRKPRLRWVIVAIILILVGVGAIVGGVVGTRESHSGHNSAAAAAPAAANDTADVTPLETIRIGSRLAVTGYKRDNSDYAFILFYQDPNNRLRFSSKESKNGNWNDSTILDNLKYEPQPEGAITMSTYLYDPPMLELFYEDTDHTVRGQIFRFGFEDSDEPVKGHASSINDYPLSMAEGTRLSSYFPFIVSQDADDQIRWTRMLGQNKANASQPWWINSTDALGITGSDRAGLLCLPIAQDYDADSGGGVIYRSSAEQMYLKVQNDSAQAPQNDDVSWRRGGGLEKPVPADTPLAGFAVGRPYDDDNQVNTYVLYQDDGGAIQVVWQDDASGQWKGPATYDVFEGAAAGTDIACLMPPAPGGKLSQEQDMNRCFFQVAGGRVRQVWFDGSNWNDEGIVPLT